MDFLSQAMDFLVQFQPILIALVVIAIIFLYWNYKRRNPTKKLAPEASGRRPIMGHLHVLDGDEPIQKKLGAMADTHGPLFSMRLGSRKVLVVSDWKTAKECFTTNDKLLSNRPVVLGTKLMFHGSSSIDYVPYSDYWRDLRKIISSNLLSNNQINRVKPLRTSEIDCCFETLYNQCKNGGNRGDKFKFATVKMDSWFGDLTYNVIARVVAGKKNFYGKGDAEAERYVASMNEALGLLKVFAFSDVIPSLSWLDNIRGLVRNMKKCSAERDAILTSWVEEHRVRRISGNNNSEPEPHDFIDACLDILERSSLPGDDPDLVIISLCLDMMLGGSDTGQVSLTWALSLLLNHPQVLQKAREEVDTVVGKNRLVDESDIPNLPYIRAIMKESMRLYPAGPIIERITYEDCEISGVYAPAGTNVWINLWKIHRDGTIYDDPSEFRPDRFLTGGRNADLDLKGQHYELLPFGGGRKMCPGLMFAFQLLHVVLARLLHQFDITTVEPGAKVDMAEAGGLPSYKIVPLEVLIKPRLDIGVIKMRA